MTSKAARRRLKKRAMITLPGQAPQPQRGNQGARNELDRAPMETVLTARLQRLRLPDTPENRTKASNPLAETEIGRRIMDQPQEARDALANAAKHLASVYAAYRASIGAPQPTAKCLAILAPTDAMEAADHHIPIDTRSDEDRARAAQSAWMRVHGWLGHAPKSAQTAALNAICYDLPVRDWQGALIGLDCIAQGLRGEVPKVERGAA
jgi:hypothetical protein